MTDMICQFFPCDKMIAWRSIKSGMGDENWFGKDKESCPKKGLLFGYTCAQVQIEGNFR